MLTSREAHPHLTDEQRAELADDRMAAPQRVVADRHLEACSACRAAVEHERQAATLLRRLPELDPPYTFTLRVASASSAWLRAAQWMRLASGAAAALFVLLLGVEILTPPWSASPAAFDQARPSAKQAPGMSAAGATTSQNEQAASTSAPAAMATPRPAPTSTAAAKPAAKAAAAAPRAAASESAQAKAAPEARDAAPDSREAQAAPAAPRAAPAVRPAPDEAPEAAKAVEAAPLPVAAPSTPVDSPGAARAPAQALAEDSIRAMSTPTAPLGDTASETPVPVVRWLAVLSAALALVLGAGAIVASRRATHMFRR
jgi:hypothetical protein